jgi:hypothetical protein
VSKKENNKNENKIIIKIERLKPMMVTKDNTDEKDQKQGHDDIGGQDDTTNVGRKKIRGEKRKTEKITWTTT